MATFVERIETPGLSQLSYVVGDGDECVVVDPRRDVAVYVETARRRGCRVSWALETHVHADFVSGSRELAAATGAAIGAGPGAGLAFEHRELAHDEVLAVGGLGLRVLHTPGHSPEHVCFLLGHGEKAARPWAVLTGDTLFAGALGRPDLAAGLDPEEQARALHRSLHEILLRLDDGVVVLPGHGAGSPCGAGIGDRPFTSIGYERRHAELLDVRGEEEFARRLLASLPEQPTYYPRLKELNAQGAELLADLEPLRSLSARQLADELANPGALLLDLREIDAFGAAHAEGALNVPLREASFPIWAGWMIDPEAWLLLVGENDEEVREAREHLLRVGLDRQAGFLLGGFRRWWEAALPIRRLPQLGADEVRQLLDGADDAALLLDVRGQREWCEGHIPGARHLFLGDLASGDAGIARLPPTRPIVTYCGSGYRASIAASELARRGLRDVRNFAGSMTAWQAAGYPLEDPG